MTENNELPDSVRNRVSRRTVVKAAAWSVPAVVVATASPAAAAVSGTIVIDHASGSGSVQLLNGLVTYADFTVVFGGTSNTPHPVTLSVSPVSGLNVNLGGSGQWIEYDGNTGDVKPGDVMHFRARLDATVAISTTVSVTAIFSDGNPPSTDPVVPLGISLNVGLKNSNANTQQQKSTAPAPDPAPTTSEPTVAPTTDPAPSAAPSTTAP